MSDERQIFEAEPEGRPKLWSTTTRKCPGCDQEQDAIRIVGTGGKIKHGMIILCVNCGEIMVIEVAPLGNDWALRPATAAELIRVNTDPTFAGVRAARRLIHIRLRRT